MCSSLVESLPDDPDNQFRLINRFKTGAQFTVTPCVLFGLQMSSRIIALLEAN